MHTSFARTSQMLTCTYLDFAMHNTCAHMKAQKTHKHAHTHSRESSNPALGLLRVLEVRFEGEMNSALLNVPISIMLVFHIIIKACFAGF